MAGELPGLGVAAGADVAPGVVVNPPHGDAPELPHAGLPVPLMGEAGAGPGSELVDEPGSGSAGGMLAPGAAVGNVDGAGETPLDAGGAPTHVPAGAVSRDGVAIWQAPAATPAEAETAGAMYTI